MLMPFFIVHDLQIRQPTRKGATKVRRGQAESPVFLGIQHNHRAAFIPKFQLGRIPATALLGTTALVTALLVTALLVTAHQVLVALRIHQEIPLEALLRHRVSLIMKLITSS